VIRLDGVNPTTIVSGAVADPTWSPDGTRIAFVRLAADAGHIAVVQPDGGGMTEITAAGGWDGRPGWGVGGRTLVFDRDPDGHSPPQCYVGVADGRVVRKCLPSSDGPQRATLWTMAPDGSGAHPVNAASSNDFGPSAGGGS
jgi:Tol biopolymer transport system component